MENIYWKKTVGTLISSIWLYTLAGIAASAARVVNALMDPSGIMGMLKDMMEGGSGMPQISMGDIIEKMFSVLVLIGYYLFFRSLTRFARLQSDDRDSQNISTVRTAYILMIVALLADFIPMIGWLISFVLIVICYIKMLSGYRGLKKSQTFPAGAREGAATLHSCVIWTLVGYVLGCIPMLGGVIEGIITIVVFFTVLSAWGRVKEAAPAMTPEEEETFVRDEPPAYKQVLGDWLIIYSFIALILTILDNVVQAIPDTPSGFWIGYNLFWTFVFAGIYIWMLCSSQARLNVGAKAGLGVLLLGRVIGVGLMLINSRIIEVENISSLQDILGTLSTACFTIGMLLFVWCSLASRSLKMIVTAYVILLLVLHQLQRMAIQLMMSMEEGPGAPSAALSMSSVLILSLLLKAAFFILIYYFVSRWRKQPVDVAQ